MSNNLNFNMFSQDGSFSSLLSGESMIDSGEFAEGEPSSKTIKTGEKGKKVGTPNKRWKSEHIDYLVEFLVEQVSKGNKCAKSFKTPALNAAVEALNNKFNQSFMLSNVENQLKILKFKWKDMLYLKGLSGAGWDDESKMIMFEKDTTDKLIAAKPIKKTYINCALPNFEKMRIVCGEDHARGNFQKSIYDTFVELDDQEITVEGVETQVQIPSANEAVPPTRGKKRKHETMEIVVDKLVGGLENLANAIFTVGTQDWRASLNKTIMNMEGFDEDLLESAYDEDSLAKGEGVHGKTTKSPEEAGGRCH